MEWNLQIMNGGASRRTCALPIEYKRQDPPPAPSQTRGISPMRIDRAVSDSGPNARASVLIGLMLLRGSAPRADLADEPDSRAAVDFFEKSVRPSSARRARSAMARGSSRLSCDWTAARRSSQVDLPARRSCRESRTRACWSRPWRTAMTS